MRGRFFILKLTFVDATSNPSMVDIPLFNWVKTKCEIKKCPVFRFYSLIMYGMPVEKLAPLPSVTQLLRESHFGDSNTKDFDIAYANQLLMNPSSFVDLMQIMGSFQHVEETIILSNYTHPLVYPILDSLMKFIQQRYSIESYIVNDLMDINDFKVSNFGTDIGYQNLMQDLDRYKQMFYTREQILKEEII